MALGLHPRGSKASIRWCCVVGLEWRYPSTTWRLVCPQPAPNAILGPALPVPRLALGHA